MENRMKEQLRGKKILIATTPVDGHVNPLTGLARFLASAGCDVRWYTSIYYKDKIEKLGLRFYPFVQVPEFDREKPEEIFPEREQITDAGARANFDITNFFVRMAPGQFNDIRDIETSFPFDILIADNTFCAIPLVRATLNKPVISIGIMPLAEESVDLGPFGPGFMPPATEQQKQDMQALRRQFYDVVFKESIDVFSAILKKHHIEHERSILFDTLIKLTDLHLQIGTPSFEYQRSDLGENIRFIGPLLPYTSQRQQRPWFDDRLYHYRKVVLVTQGTIERDTTKILEPTLKAFRATDILVIATTGGNQTACLRKKYPQKNLIIEDYLPFAEVMKYAQVYVTNGGYGGVLLSIMNQLPMVAAGLYEGKAEICSRIGHFKCGVNLQTETPTSEMITEAVTTVLNDKQYRENVAGLSVEMNEYQAEELCAGYIVQLLEERERQPQLAD